MRAQRCAGLLLALGLGVVATGCAERTGEVAGKVTVGGAPLNDGIVTFFPEQGQPVASFVKDGMYYAPGVAYGNYRVTVTPVPATPEVTTTASGKTLKPGEVDPTAKAAPKKDKPKGPVIAEKYNSADTSELSTKVDQPSVTYDITLN